MQRLGRVNAGETLHALRKVLVGVGPILGPPAAGASATGDEAETAAASGHVGVLGADEMELAFGSKDGSGSVAVLDLAVVAKSAAALGEGGCAEEQQSRERHGIFVST